MAERASTENIVTPPGWFDLPRFLAYLYQPILPYLRKFKWVRQMRRGHDPRDILLPEGYAAEVVATGFTAPVHACFDPHGNCYVVESGHKVEAPPRILKMDLETGLYETLFTLPEERWIKSGAITGACWHEGYLYFNNTDTLSRLGPDGRLEDVVAGLPGRGDHQANHPVVGPDGRIYFGMGTATNLGVVGPDSLAFEWLPKFPTNHDVPARDLTLAGRNFESRDVLGSLRESVRTGAFSPFGVETSPGQVVKGDVKCNGAVLRCDPDGGNLEVVAWGLRNPYGIAFHPDGRLFVTEHGSDQRGARYIVGDLDDFYQIEEGRWYGWPDFASGIRLDDPYWGEGGRGKEPVLAEHPDPHPPRPLATFEAHAAANGFDFCRDAAFGFPGDAFVALFGDLAPVTAPGLLTPAGFKVARLNLATGEVVDFAVNRTAGPASKLGHGGFERPSHVAFGPDGALYVVDWGEIEIAPEAGGIRTQQGGGSLWRIRRTPGPRGERPAEPVQLPFYAFQWLAWLGMAVGLVALVAWLLARARRRRRRRRRTVAGRIARALRR